MKPNLTRLSDTELRMMLKNSKTVLQTITDGFSDRPDVQQVIGRLMDHGDDHATGRQDPELVRLLMRAGMMALANVQAVAAVNQELARRHSDEN